MNRRDFLRAATAASVLPWTRDAFGQKPYALKAAPALQHMVGAGNPATPVWAYNGTVPGPLLRYRQGERLRIEVENQIDFETTVHWHGIRLPNRMDGVPHLTQEPIRKGGRFLYEFDLPDAGTFWYHPHLGSAEQVGRGLAGPLIVEEREPPKVDRDLVWFLSDWRLNEAARITPDFLHPRDATHNGRLGNTVTLNGSIAEEFGVRAGERMRLRLVNASNARIYGLRFDNHTPWLIAFDGHPVTPRLEERIVLGPAQRADLILDCGGAPNSRHRVIDDFYPRGAYRLLDLAYSADEPLMRTLEIPSRLPANPVAVPDLDKAERHKLVLGGGAMGRVPDQKAHRGMFWTMNGRPIAEHTHHEPLLSLAQHASCRIQFVNETAWHHPMHLHGHVFRVLSRNGKTVADEWGDTVLVDPRGSAEIAFVADNPGNWMLHCHVLEHQATGMMATIRVG